MSDSSESVNASPLPPPVQEPLRPLPLFQKISQWAFAPATSNNRVRNLFRIATRIVVIMYHESFKTHLALRASALTFSIILSLVPILALSTSILKGLGSDEQLKMVAVRFIEQLEPSPPPSAVQQSSAQELQGAVSPPAEAQSGTRQPRTSITVHLHQAIDMIFQYVNQTNFATLGIFGVVGLIGVVLLVLSSIENAMNAIWHTTKGRSFYRKTMDYLALLVLLPISLNIALAAEAILANQKIMSHISVIVPTAWLAALIIKFVPFMFTVITLMITYLFFPHAKVKAGAALAGSVFAALFWFIFQKIYIVLQVGVASYNAIYGSFATIPLFLIWLQIGWTFILLGASLAHAIHIHSHYVFSEGSLSPQRLLQIAIDMMLTVYDNFEKRCPTPLSTLYEKFPKTRCEDINTVASLLIKKNLLSSSESNNEEILTPVTPATKLRVNEIVRAILGDELLLTKGGVLASQAIAAASGALQSNLHTSSLSVNEGS